MALKDCNEAISMNDEIDANAYRLRGEIHMEMQMYNLAIIDFNNAIIKENNQSIFLVPKLV